MALSSRRRLAPYGYDLTPHAVLSGFVLSMAMGHWVIVIPAIAGAAAPFHPAMYAGLGLLRASLAPTRRIATARRGRPA